MSIGFTAMVMVSIVETDLLATRIGIPFLSETWLRNENTIHKGYHNPYITSILFPYAIAAIALIPQLIVVDGAVKHYYAIASLMWTLMFLIGI